MQSHIRKNVNVIEVGKLNSTVTQFEEHDGGVHSRTSKANNKAKTHTNIILLLLL